MTLSLTDTLSGEREPFEASGDSVLLYVCGLTVSDDPHLGHARLWAQADILHRWLAHEGYDVRHVENVTDVNEKITARVGEREEWETEADVARHYTNEVLDQMRNLNLLRAEVYPRVSEHVPEIVDLVETLIEQGHAYESNGSVYFDVTSFEEYGKLSNQEIEAVEEQGDPDERSEKRNPADFALWKAGGVDADAVEEHRKHEHDGPLPEGQTWESPWGEGRPGWHIECSAMSMTHLGETLDIHMGGQDLVFPHHENEIAQSEAATGQRFANHWLHVGFMQAGSEKMSSSLGNYFTVADAVREFGVNVLRTFYASAEYRSQQAYTEETIEEARRRWERLERAYETAVEHADGADALTKTEDGEFRDGLAAARAGFEAAMNDDLNAREAMAELLEVATAVNRHVEAGAPYDYQALRESIEFFEEYGGDVLGLQFGDVTAGEAEIAESLVELVLDVREAERDAGNYERADDLRDRLEALGVEVEDGDDGPTYRFD
ncbi:MULTISPECIES: cysteine--tRNA ligase [Halolamina]|uniref:Cysteine--tRNA ligase n=1 Tax=Halolamina pelagica TaxID=699431 RepID=A0A1I5QWU1_9EURY|nr:MULTISPECIES: cysteine--tRNA ligase [Halolamina]NHX35577.1 cysteine--tRNA ligase [Halolamina sp. R1-12]SFP50567.1 cysteinyl-tRNA synthetase [Halolamina pelagica]